MHAEFNDMVNDSGTLGRVSVRAGRCRQFGFTLVELLVVMVILVLILAAALPLSSNWVGNARISQAEDGLLQGYQMARAVALLNSNQVGSGTTAATVDLSTAPKVVVLDSSNTVQWTGTYTTDVTATLTGSGCGNKVALDNNGMPLNAACVAYKVAGSRGTTVSGTLR
jgi:prepilin-type N-terminal cleavage/methylation domain-containing protein